MYFHAIKSLFPRMICPPPGMILCEERAAHPSRFIRQDESPFPPDRSAVVMTAHPSCAAKTDVMRGKAARKIPPLYAIPCMRLRGMCFFMKTYARRIPRAQFIFPFPLTTGQIVL